MPQIHSRQMAVLILTGTLFASPTWAANAPRPAGITLSAAARIWLLELFAKLPTPKPHPTPKAGCGIDPNGTHCG
jgi:hypothetical protein